MFVTGTDREINNLLNEFLQLETDEQRRQFLLFSGYGKIFPQDIKCTYCICVKSYSISYIHTTFFSI